MKERREEEEANIQSINNTSWGREMNRGQEQRRERKPDWSRRSGCRRREIERDPPSLSGFHLKIHHMEDKHR